MKEIERKFSVDHEKWEKVQKPVPSYIAQSYLSNSEACNVRVRIKNQRGFLTIKGRTVGITRPEFEYEIPIADARKMIETFATKTLTKYRYEVQIGNHTWEVDVFLGKLEGLIIAEIELSSEDELFELPDWAIEDVSDRNEYFNSNLVEKC